jgi:hypothetical protein
MSISSPRDFRYAQGEEVPARTVADDPHVSLYCLNARRQEAVFVETPPEVNLAADPFYYQAQFRHARRAIVMPIDSLHAVADEMGQRFERAVMIHSVGRCGSTLLSRMFARLPPCLSLSEPDVYTQLLTDRFDQAQHVPLLRSATRLCYRSSPQHRPTHLVLKFRSFCIELGAAMQQATPSALALFLYRDLERVVASGMGVFRYVGSPLWLVDQLHRGVLSRPLLAGMVGSTRRLGVRLFPALERFSSWELSRLGAVGLLAIAWLSAMERYLALQRAALPIMAVHYDDLAAQPREIGAKILAHCELSPSLAGEMSLALDGDSQAGSIIERRRRRQYELSPRDRDVLRTVLARSELIDSGSIRVPGTVEV